MAGAVMQNNAIAAAGCPTQGQPGSRRREDLVPAGPRWRRRCDRGPAVGAEEEAEEAAAGEEEGAAAWWSSWAGAQAGGQRGRAPAAGRLVRYAWPRSPAS